MKKIAISQSNYIPWKGYFDLINDVDEFVFYDCVQYTKRDWRNRNKIKTQSGEVWLTIPVKVKGKYHQQINETEIENSNWASKHWKNIHTNYCKAKYYDFFSSKIKKIYEKAENLSLLSDINQLFTQEFCQLLAIKTPLIQSNKLNLVQDMNKTERLLAICKRLKADIYVSGPSAKNYMDVQLFQRENINVEWMDYQGYKEYEQLYPPFNHFVSVIDVLFNLGPNAHKAFKSFTNTKNA